MYVLYLIFYINQSESIKFLLLLCECNIIEGLCSSILLTPTLYLESKAYTLKRFKALILFYSNLSCSMLWCKVINKGINYKEDFYSNYKLGK